MIIDISEKTLNLEALNSLLKVNKTEIGAINIGKETLSYLRKTTFSTYKGRDEDLRYNNIPIIIKDDLAFGEFVLLETTKAEE